jgi:hypothetical protein
MGKISWIVIVTNQEVLQSQGKEKHPTYNRRNTTWIGHILRRNRLETHVIEGKIEERSDGKTRRTT